MVQAVTVVLPAAEPVVKIPVGHGVQPAAPAFLSTFGLGDTLRATITPGGAKPPASEEVDV